MHARCHRGRHRRLDLRGGADQEFPLFGRDVRFTDDTVCTVAIADALLSGGYFAEFLRAYVRRYPGRGYGGMFARWAHTPGMPAYGTAPPCE